MEDVGAGRHKDNVELSASKAPLRIADPNAQLEKHGKQREFQRQKFKRSMMSTLNE